MRRRARPHDPSLDPSLRCLPTPPRWTSREHPRELPHDPRPPSPPFAARQPELPGALLHALLLRGLEDVRARPAERRLAGLKLLGVALSAGGDSEVWGGRPDALLAETLGLLRSLADIDESAGVRQLASQLHETLFKER